MNQQYRSHEELLDLVAVYALGALGAEEAREVSAHIAECGDCRREFEALRPASDAVALSVDDRLNAVDCPRMKSRLMEAVFADMASPQLASPRRLDAARFVAAEVCSRFARFCRRVAARAWGKHPRDRG